LPLGCVILASFILVRADRSSIILSCPQAKTAITRINNL
jgi:hypothetical protein